LIGVVCLSSVASGGVLIDSQDRRVEAAAFNGDEPGTKVKSATGFGPFHGSVHAEFLDRPALEGAAADATQDSTISTNLLHTASSLAASEQDASAFARSIYTVTLDVSTPTLYHLHARLESINSRGAMLDAAIRLHHTGPSGALVFDRPLQGDNQDHTFVQDVSGQLAPGRYYFEADAEALGSFGGGRGTVAADLTLEEAIAVPLPPAALAAPCAVALVLGPWGLRRAWAARHNRRRRKSTE
jgi:hypothetical protein